MNERSRRLRVGVALSLRPRFRAEVQTDPFCARFDDDVLVVLDDWNQPVQVLDQEVGAIRLFNHKSDMPAVREGLAPCGEFSIMRDEDCPFVVRVDRLSSSFAVARRA